MLIAVFYTIEHQCILYGLLLALLSNQRLVDVWNHTCRKTQRNGVKTISTLKTFFYSIKPVTHLRQR